jgi:hypothetical protein
LLPSLQRLNLSPSLRVCLQHLGRLLHLYLATGVLHS